MKDYPLQRASTARLALAALACCTTVLASSLSAASGERVETIERERAAKAVTLAPETLPSPNCSPSASRTNGSWNG